MEKKKSVNLSTVFLVISLIIIAVMGYFIYKLYNDNLTANENVEKLNEKTNSLENTINNLKETEKNNISIDSEPNNIIKEDSNVIENEESNEDIIGVWNTFQLIDVENGEIIQNLSNVLGTAYIQYGSYLKLNEDGTFLDAIYPVTSGEFSTEGTYTIAKDYYKVGDCYVFLNYSDGRTKTFMRIYYEDNVPVLSSYEEGETYQIDLKK